MLVGHPLHAGIGSAGAAILFVALIVVAGLIATGVSLATFGHAVRVGAGALGLLFAEALAPVARVNLFGRGDDPAGLRDADMVLVAVKTYDTLAALEPLRDVLAPGATIVSLQNGLLQVEQI